MAVHRTERWYGIFWAAFSKLCSRKVRPHVLPAEKLHATMILVPQGQAIIGQTQGCQPWLSADLETNKRSSLASLATGNFRLWTILFYVPWADKRPATGILASQEQPNINKRKLCLCPRFILETRHKCFRREGAKLEAIRHPVKAAVFRESHGKAESFQDLDLSANLQQTIRRTTFDPIDICE